MTSESTNTPFEPRKDFWSRMPKTRGDIGVFLTTYALAYVTAAVLFPQVIAPAVAAALISGGFVGIKNMIQAWAEAGYEGYDSHHALEMVREEERVRVARALSQRVEKFQSLLQGDQQYFFTAQEDENISDKAMKEVERISAYSWRLNRENNFWEAGLTSNEEFTRVLNQLGKHYRRGLDPGSEELGEADLIAVVDSFYAAWNAGKVQIALDHFTDSARFIPLPPDKTGAYEGKERIRDFLQKYIPRSHIQPRNCRVEENGVCWEFTVTQIGTSPVEGAGVALLEGKKLKWLAFTLSLKAQ